jgi:hypothetical protein
MYTRFDESVGCHYTPEYLCELSVKELAAEIRDTQEWDTDLLRELCYRADMLDEWCDADGETFESVAFAAAEKLNVEII